MIAHAYAAFARHLRIDEVVVVAAAGSERLVMPRSLGPVRVVDRRANVGASRSPTASPRSRPTAFSCTMPRAPFVDAEVIDRVIAALDAHDGAIPVLPVADTLAKGGETLGEIVPRNGLVSVQTPQAFNTAILRRAHADWPASEEATDDAQMVRAGWRRRSHWCRAMRCSTRSPTRKISRSPRPAPR